MTKPIRSSAARCDQIIALIDECLAEVDVIPGLRLVVGEGRTSPGRLGHLTSVGN